MPAMKIETAEGQIYRLDDFNTLGSDPSCSMQFPNAESRHARIEKGNIGWVLKDLRTLSGTRLNGTRINEAPLMPGDFIQLGSSELYFGLENEEPQVGFPMTSKNLDWQEKLKTLGNVALTDFPVLLLGPSGTGKDVIAQALHENSLRKQRPFISVNCSALTETLVESELFGHTKGSFTGAISDRKGAFEAARGGTLFLDEIGDLSYGLQAKLLRALENNEIRPVGSDTTIHTDVRIIAATHQNLKERIRQGLFRSDLFFRLSVIVVTPPALCQRMEDFEELLYHFSKIYRVRFSHFAMLKLQAHKWPGNIRELKNLVARTKALYPNRRIEEEDVVSLIDHTLLETENCAALQAPTNRLPIIREIEKQMILKKLAVNKGNQRKTALEMGMPKSTLHDRLKGYGIDPHQFRLPMIMDGVS